MEKFGIFELLDALSAAASAESASAPQPQAAPDPSDAAFSAPSYGVQTDAAERAPRPAPPEKKDALASFLARHDKISKEIDKKK